METSHLSNNHSVNLFVLVGSESIVFFTLNNLNVSVNTTEFSDFRLIIEPTHYIILRLCSNMN